MLRGNFYRDFSCFLFSTFFGNGGPPSVASILVLDRHNYHLIHLLEFRLQRTGISHIKFGTQPRTKSHQIKSAMISATPGTLLYLLAADGDRTSQALRNNANNATLQSKKGKLSDDLTEFSRRLNEKNEAELGKEREAERNHEVQIEMMSAATIVPKENVHIYILYIFFNKWKKFKYEHEK